MRIDRQKLLITLDPELADASVARIHACESCSYDLNSEENEAFDELVSLEDKVDRETKTNLVHIAGYVSRKSSEYCEDT